MPEIIDDKSEHVVPFILEELERHRLAHQSGGSDPPPFFIGLNGAQGVGKSTLVENLKETLSNQGLPTLVFSIDDLYLPHSEQERLAQTHASNPLVQHRGQPSTHDVQLGRELFQAISNRTPDIKVPSYDKSAFNGAGDRRPQEKWPVVNAQGSKAVEVVLFEGWCVGFRAINESDVEAKWSAAKSEYEQDPDAYKGQLGKQKLDSALFINRSLRDYDVLTDHCDAFIHLDAEDPLYVYDWRLGAERKMRESQGSGMTDEQVVNFVNGYYPAYELYTEVLRNGIFPDEGGKQMRLMIGKERQLKDLRIIGHRIGFM